MAKTACPVHEKDNTTIYQFQLVRHVELVDAANKIINLFETEEVDYFFSTQKVFGYQGRILDKPTYSFAGDKRNIIIENSIFDKENPGGKMLDDWFNFEKYSKAEFLQNLRRQLKFTSIQKVLNCH